MSELDRRHAWHPYTQASGAREPLLIERASGSRLYDSGGKSYIDANSSWYSAVLGHDHPADGEREESEMWRRQERLLRRLYGTAAG